VFAGAGAADVLGAGAAAVLVGAAAWTVLTLMTVLVGAGLAAAEVTAGDVAAADGAGAAGGVWVTVSGAALHAVRAAPAPTRPAAVIAAHFIAYLLNRPT
jgi:hypothetical protein